MNSEVIQFYKKAGEINRKARDYAKKIIKPGISLLEIAEDIESFVRKQGGELAFPVNLSLNDVAAHYTPSVNDTTIFTENDLLKVDIGVHVNGYVSDSAFSISFNDEHKGLIKASEAALNNALKIIQPELEIREIGKTIQETIESFGFKPVVNLTGHSLERYNLHAGLSIPNVGIKSFNKIKEGQVIAIEPFATNGAGKIQDGKKVMIYAQVSNKSPRSAFGRKLLNEIGKHKGLPFATRWIKSLKGMVLERTLNELVSQGILYDYPILREVGNGSVSQAEHTVIVLDKPIIITL